MLHLPHLRHVAATLPPPAPRLIPGVAAAGEHHLAPWATALAFTVLRHLTPSGKAAAALFDSLQIRWALAEIFSGLGLHDGETWRAAAHVRVLLAHTGSEVETGNSLTSPGLWSDPDARWIAAVSEANGITYFNKEASEELFCLLEIPGILTALGKGVPPTQIADKLSRHFAAMASAARSAGYNLDLYLHPALPSASANGRPASPARKTAKPAIPATAATEASSPATPKAKSAPTKKGAAPAADTPAPKPAATAPPRKPPTPRKTV